MLYPGAGGDARRSDGGAETRIEIRKWKSEIGNWKKKRGRNELVEWTLWQTEEREGTRRGDAESFADGGARARGKGRGRGGSGTRGAAGVWKRGIGEGGHAGDLGLGLARPADAGLAIWREGDHKVARIHGGGDPDAGSRDRREYRALFGGERSAVEPASVSGFGAARHTAREQAEL